MSKINLEKNDYNRVLLTDVLPYEVPFILTNEGFYKYLKSNSRNEYIDRILFSNEITNALKYRIVKDKDSERSLYLVHPSVQAKVCDIYKNYNQLISYLCSRSSYSLRFPSKIALHYYSKNETQISNEEKYKDEGVGIDKNNEPVYASTFFEYKDISFLYKFYESYQFHKIEKKFDFLFKFDIAKCFASISTFQLDRSLKPIDYYSFSRDFHSFEREFESLMIKANLGNTHGIVIGPEFSRIYAEIILQSIDLNIKNSLNKKGINEGEDYVIKRYVDDYFLFYNSQNIKDAIRKIVVDELEVFKLYCNEAKYKDYSVPFISGVTIAKNELLLVINELFDFVEKLESEDEGTKTSLYLYRFFQVANKNITKIKCIVFNNGISYSSITGYYFTLIKIHISNLEKIVGNRNFDQVQLDTISNFLIVVLELSFFIHAMDFRVRSTYLISQLLIIINRISNSLGDYNSESIKKKIYEESYSVIKASLKKGKLRDIECLNLLIAIRDIDIDYQMSEDMIEQITGISGSEETNYFNLMVCLFYIQNNRKYLGVKNNVVKKIIDKFNVNYFNLLNDSELTHLFFDSMKCPFLTDRMKEKIFISAIEFMELDKVSEKTIREAINSNMWFIDWNIETSEAIERLLLKKELKSPYGS